MAVSVFDLFKVGVGPSSSHTVGPMRAARMFALSLRQDGLLPQVRRVAVSLLGSLGATGRGHGSDRAVMLGLMGHEPDRVDIDAIDGWLAQVQSSGQLSLLGEHVVAWSPNTDLLFKGRQRLSFHTNGLIMVAMDAQGQVLSERTYFSVGGGFVVSGLLSDDPQRARQVVPEVDVLPLPFHSGQALLDLCATHHCSIAQVMRLNERHWRSDAEIDQGLLHLWSVMQACVQRGCEREPGSMLPGHLQVQRRAPTLWHQLQAAHPQDGRDPWRGMDWVNLWALAVNEENASGGRVVTAPTNGAAGIIPAVLHHLHHSLPEDDAGRSGRIIDFLLTAGAVGLLYKENASISGAEVGCQGEVGVACSMAAAGLCAALGGTPLQVENAAEVGMEHCLGLTCDPVGGLVQIPCIERNAMASVQAINAARLALLGDGHHRISLDQVIRTMRQTGADMKDKYKETARGGLAVSIVAC